jgi:uncharacterized heparinase superfamily protein
VTDQSATGTSQIRLLDRLLLRWLAGRVQMSVLVSQPEPRMVGQYARGKQMLAGNFLVAGELIEAQAAVPFAGRTAAATEALHGFGWLDHLAAVGDREARALAQAGLRHWIARFGKGKGPGWAPGLVGRRIIRWIAHAIFLMQGMEEHDQRLFLHALALHAAYLERRAGKAASGLPRIEAQVGLLYATLSLEGMSDRIAASHDAVLAAARVQITEDGGIATRNPEELLQVFELLAWAIQAMADHGHPLSAQAVELLDRMAGALRVVRHADGALARFHGGGRGQDGALAAALVLRDAINPAQTMSNADMAMGFVRLSGGRSSVIVDAAAPPLKAAPARAHASTLAFELTSNRRPLIVSFGDGSEFGAEWHRASRATASHSTLAFEGYSSSRFATQHQARLELADGPRHVGVEFRHAPYSRAVRLSHDGYLPSHGLEHLRYLDLSSDGCVLIGEDSLISTSKRSMARFDEVMARTGGAGVPFALRFHLHPEAEPSLDMNATAVSVLLRSGEIWVFRADGLHLALAPSVYLEKGRLKPRPSQQIVLSLRATGYTSQINWSLSKAQDTPLAIRDTVQADPFAVPEL